MLESARPHELTGDEQPGEGRLVEQICAALARPEPYPDHPGSVDVRETHISWVFVTDKFAYKLKKPLVLDFLDYGTPERRRKMCHEEVRLNRRLAPDLYLGVRGVRLTDGVAELTDDDDPRAADFLVEMRRYNEEDTVAARLERGELTRAQVVALGQLLAGFHRRVRRARADRAPALAAERQFERNVHELMADVDQRGEFGRIQALERFAHAFVRAHAATFQKRALEGRIREGHGDLRAEHVLVGESVQIVDCVEFDPALREIDVGDDLAFMVLDLTARGGERFGEVLVKAYRDAGGDPGEDSLIAFYATYRALVRAKTALLRATQLKPGGAERARESAGARDLITTAERFAWRARLPLVIVVCGAPASGKSSLARALSNLSRIPQLNSDLTRKRLVGVGSTQRADAQAYTSERSRQTYAELGRRAVQEVAAGGGAIVDATFRHLGDLQAFATAFGKAAPLLFIECRAPRAVLLERAARRERDRNRVSDANLAVVLREQRTWDPLDEVSGSAHVPLRTDRPMHEIVGDVMALLDLRMR